MRPRRWAALLLVLAVVGVALWRSHRPAQPVEGFTLRGETMGTTYTVKIQGQVDVAPARLQAEIDERLRAINRAMSTWDPTSEISRINAAPAGRALETSPDFNRVLRAALWLSEATGGAFDVTMGPLVNLWGFGPPERSRPPSPEEVAAAMARSGFRRLAVNGRRLVKSVDGMYLDFSGIAKGYGVDAVAAILERHGSVNHLVEIGGEVAVRGPGRRNDGWAIGIERPSESAGPGATLRSQVRLTSGALATSGSYRRFRRAGARKDHHIIDPRTGAPTRSALVSVTVYAPDCMTADGSATALMVMGTEKGLRWVEARAGIEAMFVEASAEGGFVQRLSSGFARLIE